MDDERGFVVDLSMDDALVVEWLGGMNGIIRWVDVMRCDRNDGVTSWTRLSNGPDINYAFTLFPLSTSRLSDVDLLHSTRCH
jgi:hypothetical protein